VSAVKDTRVVLTLFVVELEPMSKVTVPSVPPKMTLLFWHAGRLVLVTQLSTEYQHSEIADPRTGLDV